MTRPRPNIILLIVDALRHDRMGISGYKPSLTPTLDRLARQGFYATNNFSVGCPTQIAMPGLFSSTLPLDHGGYDKGIQDRPLSFVEVLNRGGYRTHGISTCTAISQKYGYDRGFDEFTEIVDMVLWLQGWNSTTFNELMNRWNNGELNDDQTLEIFIQSYPPFLAQADRFLDTLDRLKAPQLWKSRKYWRKRLSAEKDLFKRDPRVILLRKKSIGTADFFSIGDSDVTPDVQRRAQSERKWDKRMNKYIFIRNRRRYYRAYTVNTLAAKFLNREHDQPFFMMLHYLDIHESKLLVPSMDIRRAMELPADSVRTLWGRKNFEPVGVLYDLAVANMDRQIARLLRILRRSGNLENTILVITADHGVEIDSSVRGVGSNMERAFFEEHIHVPLIISGPSIEATQVHSLISHLDLGPSILELVGLDIPAEFSGRPISKHHNAPSDHVTFENTGRGWCDIQNKTIFLGVRSDTLKVVFSADKFEPVERDVFDLASDPDESRNIVDTDECQLERSRLASIARQRLEQLRVENSATA
jgi:arylsulfatase A-like enzyme